MNIITPATFAEDISGKAISTVDNASVVAVSVPFSIGFTTIGIYKQKQQTTIDITGATYENFFAVIASVVLVPGVHFIRKKPEHFISAPDAKNIFAVAVSAS
jgi:hypothetical protein